MDIFYENINSKTIENENYRKVAFTGKHLQFVYMSIKPKDNIHLEIHHETDQFIRIEKGYGIAIVDGKTYELYDNIGIVIPAGSAHEIINSSTTEELKLYTIYSPPEHPINKVDVINPNKIIRKIKILRI